MKLIAALVLILIVGQCKTQQVNSSNITSVTMEARTRGYSEVITASPGGLYAQEITSLIENSSFSKNLDHNESSKLIDLLDKIPLLRVPDLESPSDGRHSDRALYVYMIFTTIDGTVTESASFDRGNPPPELSALVDWLVSIEKD